MNDIWAKPAWACCTDAGSSCYGCQICLNAVPAIYLNRLETDGLYVSVTFIHAGSAWMQDLHGCRTCNPAGMHELHEPDAGSSWMSDLSGSSTCNLFEHTWDWWLVCYCQFEMCRTCMGIGPALLQARHAAQIEDLHGCSTCMDTVPAFYLNMLGTACLFVIFSFRFVWPAWI